MFLSTCVEYLLSGIRNLNVCGLILQATYDFFKSELTAITSRHKDRPTKPRHTDTSSGVDVAGASSIPINASW